jgi:uncharacterized repeat protein (TIGR01451 family)
MCSRRGIEVEEQLVDLVDHLVGRASPRSTLLITTTREVAGQGLGQDVTGLGIGPSAASTSRTTPSTMASARSTSPPKSAWPGVSTRLMRVPCHSTDAALARMVMPRSSLLVRGVHDPVDPGLVGPEHAGGDEHGVDQGGLAVVDVRDQSHIPNGCSRHGADGQPASFTVDVPAGASVEQVLLYWEGFNRRSSDPGDADISVNGIPVTGIRIGGPTEFFSRAWSSTWRADITSLDIVGAGTNTLTISNVSFTNINNGAGVLVVYDDGSDVDLQLVDGNDLAYNGFSPAPFSPPLDTTVPQTFDFAPVPFDREVDISMFASSVDGTDTSERPNAIVVTIDGTTTTFDTPFQSNVGNEWDAVTLNVTVPAGADSMTIQALSADVDNSGGNPASFAWIGVGVSIPLPAELGDFVWLDANENGIQDAGEAGVAGVLVTLNDCSGAFVDSQLTGASGDYLFTLLEPGCYQVVFDLPDGFAFTTRDAGADDSVDSDADPVTGESQQVTLVSGASDLTVDAGLVSLVQPEPGIDIEKLTNGNDADGANDADVPQITPGATVTWTFVVTNTGNVPFAEADVSVVDTIVGPITNIVDKGDGDAVLSPGEVWIYEATGVALDLDGTVPSGIVIVDGCNPDGTDVPGPRNTYENIGTVTVPGAGDSDPSHYCNPPMPGIRIEKATNGNDADGANDADVPQITPGATVTWTYVVTNTGDTAYAEADVDVADDIPGVTPVLDPASDAGGDGVLSPGESWTYTATGVADDLDSPSLGTVVVDGCNPDGTAVPGDRATYQNVGTVTVPDGSDSDPSHYCNPPDPRIDIEKATNGNDADGANDADVPQITPGATVTWTYVVTNTGNVAFAEADVDVADDIPGVTPVLDPASDAGGDGVLSPGESWTYTATGVADDLDSPSLGTVVVDGCNPDGTAVPGPRNTYENIGTVTVPGAGDSDPSHYCNPPVPAIDLQKTVYAGHDGGASCPGVELVSGLNGDPVTYCFEITNTGETYLDVTEVTDPDLGVSVPVGALMAPGDVVTVFHEATIAGDLVNTAEVCGNPTDDAGNDLADLADVCDDDPAEVVEELLGSIGDFVWEDQNANGIQDPGEPGVSGAFVDLTDCLGNILDTQVTGADGAYLFTGLEAGCYKVTFDLPTGYVFTTANIGDDALDSDADPVTGMSPQVNLGVGEDDLTIDAGAVPLGSIGDFVWEDQNGNGLQDPGEPGVLGTLVTLTDCDGNLVATFTTGGTGAYLFTDLEPGCYKVTFDLPAGLAFTTPDAGDDTLDSDADPVTGMSPEIFLAPGEDNLTIDAGAVALLGSIGDFVWEDQNANGIQDPGEPGVSGAFVDLTDCLGNILDTQVTGADGAYLFTGLEAGCYKVTFDLPTGYVFTTANIGDDALDSDADPVTGMSPEIDLAAGEDDLTIDAGAVPLGSIGDFVWEDQNGNGLQDPGEPGVLGTLVTLTDCDGNLVATFTTGGTGAYLFTDLEPGCYKVTFDLPAGLAFTTPDAGDDTLDSDADPVTGMSPEIFLAPGEDNLTIDAGAVRQAPSIVLEKFTKVIVTQVGGDLCDAFGKPAQLTMLYTGDGPEATSHSQDPSKVSVTGDPNDASPVLIIASEKALAGGKIYSSGTVNLGESFVIDATLGGDSSLRADTYVTIYDAAGTTVLQQIKFHTSCSQPLFLGNQWGAIQLTGFEDSSGNGATLPPPDGDFGVDADTPTGPTANTGDTIQWTYFATNTGDLSLTDVVVTDDNGTAGDASDDFAAAPLLEGGFNVGDGNLNGLLDPGEEWLFQATGIAGLGQYANIGTVVAQPLVDGNPSGDPVSDTDPSHYLGVFGGDLCESFGKPAQLTMLYTGDGPEATSHSQDASKVVVTGDPNDASPVYIVASKDPLGGGEVYFAGTVDLGGEFVIDSTLAGKSNLPSSTHVTIYASQGGAVLQQIEFHTSCSQPLFIGDQFGAIQLVGFVDVNGNGPGVPVPTGVSAGPLTFKDREARLDVTNHGAADVFITSIEISFPQATNGLLKKIKRDGDTIYDPSPDLGSPVVVTEAQFVSDANKRKVKAGETDQIRFEFQNTASTDPGAYVITVTFSDGSVVTVP